MGKNYGVAILAEGVIEKLNPAELADLEDVERDEHGHIRFAEVDLARKVKVEVQSRLASRGIKTTLTNKNIGYELRCCDPIPFDMAYCRDLGYSAIKFLVGGGSGAMATVQGGKLTPMYFKDLRDPVSNKTKVRNVDIRSESYRVAREYMLRLESKDFEYSAWVEKLAEAAKLSVGDFRSKFEYLRDRTVSGA